MYGTKEKRRNVKWIRTLKGNYSTSDVFTKVTELNSLFYKPHKLEQSNV